MSILRLRGRCRPLPIATSPLLRNALPNWRLRFIHAALMLMFVAILCTAFHLILFRQADLQAQGEKVSNRDLSLPAFRGMIFDRHGNLLAGSVMTRTIIADPLQIKHDLAVQALAEILQQNFTRQLSDHLAQGGAFSLELPWPLGRDARNGLNKLNSKGIYSVNHLLRIEPEALNIEITHEKLVQVTAEVLQQEFARRLRQRLTPREVTASELAERKCRKWNQEDEFRVKLASPLNLEERQRLRELALEGIYPESGSRLRIEPKSLCTEKATLQLAQQQQIKKLAALLDLEASKLASMLEAGADKKSRYLELRRQVREDNAFQIAELNMVGLRDKIDFKRYYPLGKVSAHLVGFTGLGDSGQEGVERVFETELSGTPGLWKTTRDRKGGLIEDRGVTYAADGQDVHLSLDSRIQYLVFIALQQALARHRATAGSVVVLDAQSGEVLALVNLPSYDPNDRRVLSGDNLANRSVDHSYELGSVMKPFTIARALDKGIVRPNTVLDCTHGSFQVSGEAIPDHRSFGSLSVTQILHKSSNIGAARVGMAMSREEMGENLAAFGFGQKPGLGFPIETAGRLRPWKQWQPIDQSRIAYGYGFSASVLQLARAYLAFTREDRSLPPLSMLALNEPQAGGKPILSARTRHEMLDILEGAVSAPGATGGQARVPGYRVGGKTGTARKLVKGRYESGRYLATFVGIAPMSAPRVIIAVSIDDPTTGKYGGGDVAAPVFAEVAAGTLRSLGVAPDMPLQLAATILPSAVATGEVQ